MSAFASAVLTAVLAGVLALAAYADPILVGLAVLVVQYMLAAGPPATGDRGRRIPTPMFTTVLAAGLTALAVSLFPQALRGETGLQSGRFSVLDTGVFAGVQFGLVVAFFVGALAQMRRRDGRTQLTRSYAHTVTVALLAVLTVGWVGAAHDSIRPGVVALAAAAMAAGVLLWQIPRFETARRGLELAQSVLGALVPVAGGVVAAVIVSRYAEVPMGLLAVAVVGAMCALFAMIGHDVAEVMCSSIRHAGPRWGFVGALPVALVAPLAFVAGQLPGL